ncbi:MAG: hypothetical protein OHK0013_23870 [Sandaracinaceae bacterium]
MSAAFDASAIERLGWRQGAALGTMLAAEARKLAPSRIAFAGNDCLIVTSHDCDVVNPSLDKEPVVEVLRAPVSQGAKPDKQQAGGRNPRALQVAVALGSDDPRVLSMKVHDRWAIPRELLASEPPSHALDDKTRRLIAEWLAKRYIRAAFPTAFDRRWRPKMKEWTGLLEAQSQWLQGIYLRLDTQAELPDDEPYQLDLIVAVPDAGTKDPGWATKRSDLESLVETFWGQFAPGILCGDGDVTSTSQITLAELEKYQRFDADWVSFADDSPATPITTDLSL